MMYSLLTAFESLSIMCSETTLCLFAFSTAFSLGSAARDDDMVSVTDRPEDTGPTEIGSQSPIPAAEPIESQTIRDRIVRFITHGPFPCQNNPLFPALSHDQQMLRQLKLQQSLCTGHNNPAVFNVRCQDPNWLTLQRHYRHRFLW